MKKQFHLEAAMNSSLDILKRNLYMFNLTIDLSDRDTILLLASALRDYVILKDRKPHPIDRHEECFDCDNHICRHRQGGTHCDACGEDWPCESAGQLDEDKVWRMQEAYIKLKNMATRSAYEEVRMLNLSQDLDVVGMLPTGKN